MRWGRPVAVQVVVALVGRIPEGERDCDWELVAHQVSEVILRVEVTEHRRMWVRCGCERCTLAQLPEGVPAGAFGSEV
jgi:hypothetical protein